MGEIPAGTAGVQHGVDVLAGKWRHGRRLAIAHEPCNCDSSAISVPFRSAREAIPFMISNVCCPARGWMNNWSRYHQLTSNCAVGTEAWFEEKTFGYRPFSIRPPSGRIVRSRDDLTSVGPRRWMIELPTPT